MLHLDHYGIFSQNFYEATFQISQETGLGNYDGGWFPRFGFGVKVIPLGDDQFLEVEGFVDTEKFKQLASAPPFDKLVARRQAFFIWALRTDSLEELEELARVCGWEVDHEVLDEGGAQQMMNGHKVVLVEAPKGVEGVLRGMPQIYFWPDMSQHDARFPIAEGTGDGREPQGVSWIEVGGAYTG